MIDSKYLFFVFPLISVAVLIWIMRKERNEEKKNTNLQEKLSILEKQGNNENYTNELKTLVSDIKENIDSVEDLKNTSDSLSMIYKGISTGIPVIDTLLLYKRQVADSKNIKTEFEIAPMEKNIISERELISLVGNLMDNAIEAAEKCEEKWIKLESRKIKGQFVIKLTNSKNINEYPLKENMRTTKDDKNNHGLGTRIVKKIIKDNKGYIKFNDRGDSFEVFAGFSC